MNIIEFIKEYPDEVSCKAKFKQYREQVGVVCPKCGGKSHYWKSDKESYECKKCGERIRFVFEKRRKASQSGLFENESNRQSQTRDYQCTG